MAQSIDMRDASSGSPSAPPLSNASALGAARYPGLANPVAFHLLRLPAYAGRMLWLLALYEEEGGEFEAAARLDPGLDPGSLAESLAGFMASEQCFAAVVEPLARRVAKRLGR